MTGVLVCIAMTVVTCLLVALNEAERDLRPHREHRDDDSDPSLVRGGQND